MDQIRTMRIQETSSYKISKDYFHDGAAECNDFMVSPEVRATMLSWAYDVLDVCKIGRHVAITAVTYLDRYLADNIGPCANEALSSRRNFQLTFIACLIIALKNCAGMKVESEFVSGVLCHGLYHEKEILDTEMEVLRGLGWRLNGPTAIDFIHVFMQLLPNQDDLKRKTLLNAAEVLAEHAMMNYSLAVQEPSLIAYASINIALSSLGRKYFGGMQVDDMDRFIWMQSVAMIGGLDIEGPLVRLIHGEMVENCLDLGGCDSSESSSTGSPRLSICVMDR